MLIQFTIGYSMLIFMTQFNSFEHLKELVDTTDTNDVSNKMKLFNSKRKSLIYNMWDNLIKTKIQ
jgi:hypothetical protein